MRRNSVYDPRYVRSVMPVANGLANTARCQVLRPNGERPGWVAGVGNTADTATVIWEGVCRIQPVIDMRARMHDFDGEYDAAQATRFNMPFEQNEHGAVLNDDGTIRSYGPDPDFAFGDFIDVTEVFQPGEHNLLAKRFTVRNASVSTNMFQFDLLTDVGTSLHG